MGDTVAPDRRAERPVALEVRALAKLYGGRQALQPVDFAVEQGEFFVLLGPSGCGKTTLLRLIAGLLEPSGGRIFIDGRDVTRVPGERRDIAMVFQDYALYPHMSAHENLAFGLRRHKVPRAEIARRIAKTAALLGIDRLLTRRPAELSGGEQQRVALGRAIVREPRLFLMDEPLSNLDAQIRATTRAEIKQLQRRLGVATVYVTHDQVEALTLADRVGVMHDGRLEQIGPPLEVYARPATLFVARFLASPRYNMLPAMLDGLVLRTAVADFPVPDGILGGARDVVLGMKPEQLGLSLVPTGAPELEVVLVELLGPEVLVHARESSGASVVARVPVAAFAPDTRQVWLRPEHSVAQVFDATSGRLLATLGPA